MALTTFNEDMEIISKQSTYPNDADGMTPEELKAAHDKAGKLIKEYINNTLLKELGGTSGAASLGVDKVNGTDMGSTIQAALNTLAAQIVQATLGTIPDKSIGESKFADLAVSTRALGELAVTTAKLAAGAVTDAKLATGAVTSSKIYTGAVTNEKTDFSAGFAPAGPIKLTKGVHYFESAAELPETLEEGRVYFLALE